MSECYLWLDREQPHSCTRKEYLAGMIVKSMKEKKKIPVDDVYDNTVAHPIVSEDF